MKDRKENNDEENRIAKENKLSDMDYLRSKVVSTSEKSQTRKTSKKAQNFGNDDSEYEDRNRESSGEESGDILKSKGVDDDAKNSSDDDDDDDDDEEEEEEEEEEEGHDNSNNPSIRNDKSKSSAAFGTIKMRGLPFKAKEQHIKDFFSPLRILDVRIIKNNKGKPTGCAFVDFASETDLKEALKRDRDCIEGRYIELFRDKEQESNQAATKEKPWMKKLADQGDDEEFESIAEVSVRFPTTLDLGHPYFPMLGASECFKIGSAFVAFQLVLVIGHNIM